MDDGCYEEGTRSPRIQGGFMSYFRTEVKLFTQAEKIKKRMKSLGYYDCWEKDNGLEVVVP